MAYESDQKPYSLKPTHAYPTLNTWHIHLQQQQKKYLKYYVLYYGKSSDEGGQWRGKGLQKTRLDVVQVHEIAFELK